MMYLNMNAFAAVTKGAPGGRRVSDSADPVIMWSSMVEEKQVAWT